MPIPHKTYVPFDKALDWVRSHPLPDGRIIPMCLWGPKGVGKCVHADTNVFINGKKIAIQQLWDDHDDLTAVYDVDGIGQWRFLPAGKTTTLSTSETSGCFIQGPVSAVYRQRVHEQGWQLSFENGQTLTLTKQHRLLGVEGWTREFEIGQLIAGVDDILNANEQMVGGLVKDAYGKTSKWVMIVAVEEMLLDEYVYDMEVVGHHNYVANGLLSHNTASVRAYTRERKLGFRGYHPAHDRTGADIVGLAMLDERIERTVYARPLWLPGENDPVVFERSGVLFIDELNRAPLSVLQGLMEPLGEGTIEHSGWRLPSLWGFVCAANPPADGYNVAPLDEALSNRLLHIPMGFDIVRWAAWATSADVHAHLVDFAVQKPQIIADKEVSLPENIDIAPTPRSIEYLSRLYEPDMELSLLWTFAHGLIGKEAATEFFALLDAKEWAVSAEEIFAGTWPGHLQAIKAQGREDLIDASERMLLAALVRYKPSADAAERIAAFIKALGNERNNKLWERIIEEAPAWQQSLVEAALRLK